MTNKIGGGRPIIFFGRTKVTVFLVNITLSGRLRAGDNNQPSATINSACTCVIHDPLLPHARNAPYDSFRRMQDGRNATASHNLLAARFYPCKRGELHPELLHKQMQMHSRPSAGSRRQGPARIQKGNKRQAEKENQAKGKIYPEQNEKGGAPALKPGRRRQTNRIC